MALVVLPPLIALGDTDKRTAGFCRSSSGGFGCRSAGIGCLLCAGARALGWHLALQLSLHCSLALQLSPLVPTHRRRSLRDFLLCGPLLPFNFASGGALFFRNRRLGLNSRGFRLRCHRLAKSRFHFSRPRCFLSSLFGLALEYQRLFIQPGRCGLLSLRFLSQDGRVQFFLALPARLCLLLPFHALLFRLGTSAKLLLVDLAL